MGGVIGTGLFLGTAQSLSMAGPLGLLLAFALVGALVWAMMISLGEMISHLPLAGGHVTLASRLVDPAFGLAVGWTYAANWLLVLPAELAAAATLISFWSNANPAGYIAALWVTVTLINVGGTRVFGELEYWFAAIKIITIIGLLILSIVITSGGVPNTDPIGFSYWRHPGPFVQFLGIKGAVGRFAGFIAVLPKAAFAYVGVEIPSIAAGEARNPSRSIPRAIRRISFRIGLFYIAGTFAIGLIVASNDPALARNDGTALSSPFVVAIDRVGINALPSIVNAAFLTSATSAASSGLYTASRCLYGLALNDNAPPVFARLNRYGLPYVAVLTGVVFGSLAFMSAGSHDAAVVFNWLSAFCSVGGLLSWASICFCYIRFYHAAKAQDITRDFFPYRAPFQPYAAYVALVGFSTILLVQGFYLLIPGQWSASDFITRYLMVVLFPLAYLAARSWQKCKTLDLLEVDFFSGSRDNDETPEPVGKSRWRRALAAFA
ncbi:amino acid permease [Rhodotorula diobovata]|uniref:Amino acid permease n=1 Tax=Rhodotorula diobovata TaxID=5288 RepID=A0A5C5FSF2_9BASI|nr:amino acid permease [Rhodotorula diobovata]